MKIGDVYATYKEYIGFGWKRKGRGLTLPHGLDCELEKDEGGSIGVKRWSSVSNTLSLRSQ
jgi:hypothetical protein